MSKDCASTTPNGQERRRTFEVELQGQNLIASMKLTAFGQTSAVLLGGLLHRRKHTYITTMEAPAHWRSRAFRRWMQSLRAQCTSHCTAGRLVELGERRRGQQHIAAAPVEYYLTAQARKTISGSTRLQRPNTAAALRPRRINRPRGQIKDTLQFGLRHMRKYKPSSCTTVSIM